LPKRIRLVHERFERRQGRVRPPPVKKSSFKPRPGIDEDSIRGLVRRPRHPDIESTRRRKKGADEKAKMIALMPPQPV
jgi:hypothetical protein